MGTLSICVFLVSIVSCFIYGADVKPRIVYLGCFVDGGSSNRLMKDHHENFNGTLTPNKCIEHCREKGFSYAGMQNSYECYCSNTKPPDVKKTLESYCSSKCSGDDTKTCGGNNRLAVFGFPNPKGNAGEVLRAIGCYKDSDKKRLLSEYRQDYSGSLTNQKCVKLCALRGYRYAGTENGNECYCGNRKPTFKEYVHDKECSTKRCEGDVNQLCGGFLRILVFMTSKSELLDPPEAGKYIGCYKDEEDSRTLDGHLEDFGRFLTPFKCTGLCYSKGFLYSGTQYSYQCFCGDRPPSPISKVPEEECNKPCSGNRAEMCGGESGINSIRETGIPDMPVEDKYLGCFNDLKNKMNRDIKLSFDKTNSPRRCMNYCLQLDFRYSGVENGKDCLCGNEEPKADLLLKSEDCNMPCSGNPEKSCGAKELLAVYATSLAATEPTVLYLGCFEDGGQLNRLMTGYREDFLGTLTPDICNNRCREKGFPYAGTQFSYECFCSKTKPPDVNKTLESDCNTKCAGDETKTCGGDNRLAVFTTGVPDTTESHFVLTNTSNAVTENQTPSRPSTMSVQDNYMYSPYVSNKGSNIDAMARVIVKLENRVTNIENMQREILAKLTPAQSENIIPVMPIEVALPCSTVQEVEELDLWLRNEDNVATLTKHLSLVGGKKVPVVTRRILERLFTNEVAVLYNWMGKNENHALKDLAVIKLLPDLVRRNKNMHTVSDDEVYAVTNQWFRIIKKIQTEDAEKEDQTLASEDQFSSL